MDDHPGADGDRVSDDDLDAREAARVRRRDRELAAERDELMRPGMGKVFKQVTDSWSKGPSRPPKKSGKHH